MDGASMDGWGRLDVSKGSGVVLRARARGKSKRKDAWETGWGMYSLGGIEQNAGKSWKVAGLADGV